MSRQCGDCQLCCKLLPVRPLAKPDNTRCQHQRAGKGCAIYPQRPSVCRTWNCAWLIDPSASDLRRPDRSHYVIDERLDFFVACMEDGIEHRLPAIQIWVDPLFKDAHRDPALRRYLAAKSAPAIIRYSSSEGFVLVPPSMSADGAWLEIEGQRVPEHSNEEIAAVIAAAYEARKKD